MQIKKFEGPSMSEALKRVKKELGPDAVILSTRNSSQGTGAFGLFGKPVVEVTAALDRNPVLNTAVAGPDAIKSESGKKVAPDHARTEAKDVLSLREEIRGLRSLLYELRDNRARGAGRSETLGDIPEIFHEAHRKMTEAGVVALLSKKLIEKSAKDLSGKRGGADKKLGRALLTKSLMDLVSVTGDTCVETGKSRVVAFVGPTGVGKTTTIAKLAARAALKGMKVGLITIDTFRIGAVEQLKIYAEILKVPVAVASTPRELYEKIEAFGDKDLLLIDTAGRSHKDGGQISFLKEFFPREQGEAELHLLLSATTKDADLDDIIKRFGQLPVKRHLFTKLDESSSFGFLLNVIARRRVPYSYFTTGQNVPEDIEPATPERVADLILRIREGG